MVKLPDPKPVTVPWRHYHRIVASRFPPVDVFENVLDPEDLETAFAIESLTNDRLRERAGNLALVAPEDRVTGPGATPVMAAFTHIGAASRFTDGSYGVFYAAESAATAIRETRFHAERFLAATAEPPCTLEKRLYVGDVAKPLLDLRPGAYAALFDPDVDSYPTPQAFGRRHRAAGAWGLLYPSVRQPEGECLAAFRPPAVSRPRQSRHYQYRWDGRAISHVLAVSPVAY